MNLSQLQQGCVAYIDSIGGDGSVRQHLLDMGITPSARIEFIKAAPLGDPLEYNVHSYTLTIRKADAELITITDKAPDSPSQSIDVSKPAHPSTVSSTTHPGFGEGGKFHDKKSEKPLEADAPIKFALVGNQNSGKTALFNQLTGSNEHVGNFPGVTVEKLEGIIQGYHNATITDLPGVYSLIPFSQQELLTREVVLAGDVSGIINIVDATNLERNLYLTMQLLELGKPMVLALNMMDELIGNGGSVLVNELEQILGIPVVPISALKNEGIEELMRHAIHVARYQEPPLRQDFCTADFRGGAIHRCIHAIIHSIEDHAARENLSARFAACKLVEGDTLILDRLKLDQNEIDLIEHAIVQMEREVNLDRAAAMADMRYRFILEVCAKTLIKPRYSHERQLTDKLDSFLTGRLSAIPIFICVMCVVFYLTFDLVGGNLQKLLALGISSLSDITSSAMAASSVSPVLQSLVIDGIFSGVGSVVSFLPYIVVLFFFLSILEDSGYMSRVAFFMDKLLRKLGLSGRSIVPILVGFGCTVPAVMAARTLSSDRDRTITILLAPFASCSAKLPVYAFFCAAFFPQKAAIVMVFLYLTGIVVGVLVALVLKKFSFKGEAVPFVMELPNYRLPALKNVSKLLWDKAKDFLQRAFSVILIATIIIWFLQTFSFSLSPVIESSESMLSSIASLITPLFVPLGFGDWRIVTALITGFLSKEVVIASISMLAGSTAALSLIITPLGALSLLVFCLLYTPCVATIASIRRELGGGYALLVCIAQCVIAWVCAFIVFGIGSLIV